MNQRHIIQCFCLVSRHKSVHGKFSHVEFNDQFTVLGNDPKQFLAESKNPPFLPAWMQTHHKQAHNKLIHTLLPMTSWYSPQVFTQYDPPFFNVLGAYYTYRHSVFR